MTNDEIAKLAREYVAQSAEEVGTKLDPESWAFDCMMTQAKDVINFLLRTHCIVPKSLVMEEYNDASTDIEEAIKYNMRISEAAMGKKELLESLFDAETFKNSEA